MTKIPYLMPLNDVEFPIIGCPAPGPIAAQREACSSLLALAGWPNSHREETGRPRIGSDFASLSHGGGWALAARHKREIGVDVEAVSGRLKAVRRRFVGDLDHPVLDHHGDNLDTLCRLWTAKEAAFKAFGTGVDFLTGLRWERVHDHGAKLTAVAQNLTLILDWRAMPSGPSAWMAVARVDPPVSPGQNGFTPTSSHP